MSKICKFCGAINADSLKNCQRCGKLLESSSQIAEKTNTGSKKAKKRGNKVILAVPAFVVCILIAVFLFFQFQSPSEQWFLENIPSDILKYRLSSKVYESIVAPISPNPGELFAGTASKVEIVDEKKELGYPVYFCKVTQEEKNMTIYRYLKIRCERNLFHWTVNDISFYQKAEAVPDEKYMRTLLDDYMGKIDLKDYQVKSVKAAVGNTEAVVYIEGDYEFAKISGDLRLRFDISISDNTNYKDGMVQIYTCIDRCNTEDCRVSWKKDAIGYSQWSLQAGGNGYGANETNYYLTVHGEKDAQCDISLIKDFDSSWSYLDQHDEWSGKFSLPSKLSDFCRMESYSSKDDAENDADSDVLFYIRDIAASGVELSKKEQLCISLDKIYISSERDYRSPSENFRIHKGEYGEVSDEDEIENEYFVQSLDEGL